MNTVMGRARSFALDNGPHPGVQTFPSAFFERVTNLDNA
jgi:hypothetical protein